MFHNKIFTVIPDIIDNYNFIYIETSKVLNNNWNISVGVKYHIPLLNDLKLLNSFIFSYDDKGELEIIEFEGASYRDSIIANINGFGFYYTIGLMFKEFNFNLFYYIESKSLFCNGVNLQLDKQSIGSYIFWENNIFGININTIFIENFFLYINLWINFYINRMNMKILLGYNYNYNNYLVLGAKFITYYKDLSFDIIYKIGIDSFVYDQIYLSLEKKIDSFVIKIWDIPSILGDNIIGVKIGYLL